MNQDVCGATLDYVSVDGMMITFHCQLSLAHPGPHIEEGPLLDAPRHLWVMKWSRIEGTIHADGQSYGYGQLPSQ